MVRENLSVQVPTIWTLSSTKGVYKVAEASDRPASPTWNQTDHLPRQTPKDMPECTSSPEADYNVSEGSYVETKVMVVGTFS